MSKAFQQLWVRRCEVGFIAVALISSVLLLTFVIAAHDAQAVAKVALALPAAAFALLTPSSPTFDWLRSERLACPTELFRLPVLGRSPPT